MDDQQSNSKSYGSITRPTQYSNERAEIRKATKQQTNTIQQGGESDIAQIYRNAESSLSKSRESKQGVDGTTEGKKILTSEERKERSRQDSLNRRILRETLKAATTGRASTWLKNYASKKDAEFNSQNSTLQQTVSPSASITYTPTTENPNVTLSTRQNNNRSGGGGGGFFIIGGGGGSGSSGDEVGLGGL